MIVVDASTIVGAAIKRDSTPMRALAFARRAERLAMSVPVAIEIRSVLRRPKFAHVITPHQLAETDAWLFSEAEWFSPTIPVTDCRDPKDNKYLELALAANASTVISSDKDLLVLHPWRAIRILSPSAYLATG